jgi:hypothetical protein
MAFFFLSYRMEGEDAAIAAAFEQRLIAAKHRVFMAGASIRIGDNWRERIEEAIRECEYFLVLLSERSSVSEMVITEVRRVRERRSRTNTPVILPVRVNLPLTQGLLYDLDGYLNAIQQREWKAEAETARIANELIAVASAADQGFRGDAVASPGIRPNDDDRPLPVADPEPQGAAVALTSRFYQKRPRLDDETLALLNLEGRQLIKLHGPEQIGKSSLLARTIAHANQAGLAAASISFQLASADGHLDSREQGIKWFCKLLSRRLGLEKTFFEDHWSDDFGVATDALQFISDAMLPRFEKNVVVCIDNLDCAFFHESFAKAFLPLLRELYERGADQPQLKKLRMVVAYSTECWVKLSVDQSPFQGVGETLRIPPFRAIEIADLCRIHGLSLDTTARNRIMSWLGGQPYLTRLFLHHLARAAASGESENDAFERILGESGTDAGIFADHLRRKFVAVAPNGRSDAPRWATQLTEGIRSVVRSETPVTVSNDAAIRLVGLGLVTRDRNQVSLASQVYREYFGPRL